MLNMYVISAIQYDRYSCITIQLYSGRKCVTYCKLFMPSGNHSIIQ